MPRYMPLAHEYVTLPWHLPTALARCTMKSDRRRHPQSDPPTTGSSGDPKGYRSKIASQKGVARAGDFEKEPAITAYSLRPLPLCASARALSLLRGHRHRLPGSRFAPHCHANRGSPEPWKYRWAGAATPAQQSTTRPQEPPRRASDVFYGSNLYRKDNPRWPISNATDTPGVPAAGPGLLTAAACIWDHSCATRVTGGSGLAARVGNRVRFACAICTAWLLGVPRRAGARLYAMTDTEARWWYWQVIERCGGLVHQYRDSRFEVLEYGAVTPRSG